MKSKPWVTKGTIKSIKVRDKLYKEFIRSKIRQEREYKYSAFKKYRNKITGLLKISRQSTMKTLSMKTKKFEKQKNEKPCGKGSMKLYILKRLTKQIAHPLYK